MSLKVDCYGGGGDTGGNEGGGSTNDSTTAPKDSILPEEQPATNDIE
jgi:hypothetical protein